MKTLLLPLLICGIAGCGGGPISEAQAQAEAKIEVAQIFCIIRPDASGRWYVQNDVDHHAQGCNLNLEQGGDVARARTNDRRGTVTFKLMQTSDTNALLSALRNADLLAPNGAGVGALEVRDLQGTTLLSAAEAWIKKMPQTAFDREIGAREWVIRCAVLEGVVGGN